MEIQSNNRAKCDVYSRPKQRQRRYRRWQKLLPDLFPAQIHGPMKQQRFIAIMMPCMAKLLNTMKLNGWLLIQLSYFQQ